MKANEFYKLILNTQPVVRFNEKIESEFETGFDEGMMARAVSSTDDGNGCYKVLFDFTAFEEKNKKLEKPNWYDKAGNPTLKWSETNFYPKGKIEEIYFDYGYEINCLEIVSEEIEESEESEEINALRWVVDQFEKVLAGEKAGNVVESLSFAKSVLRKHIKG